MISSNVDQQYHLDVIESLKQPQKRSMGLELEALAASQPDKTAIKYEKRLITYDQFNRMSNRYSNLFIKLGLKRGDIVAIMMANRPEYLAAVAGLSKVGIIATLINIELRGEVLAYGINIDATRSIILGHEYLELFKTIKERVRLLSPAQTFIETEEQSLDIPANYVNLNALLADCSEENPATTGDIDSNDYLAYLFASGVTGKRKAVPLTHKRWITTGHQICLNCGIDNNTIQYISSPLYLNSGFHFCFSGAIISASTMVLKKSFSATKFWDDIRQEKADFFVGVGEAYRYLLLQPEKPDDKNHNLRIAISNGIRPELVQPFRERFGVSHLIEMYGKTENVGFLINSQEIPGMLGNLTLNGIRQGEAASYDDDNGEVVRDTSGWVKKCNPGETGILLCEINELNPFEGYINDPESSAKKILTDVFKLGDRYFITGDLVELHKDDYVSFVLRLGNTYRWKGKTVSADSVADVLDKFYGGIEETVVYGVVVPGMEGRTGMAAIKVMEGETLDMKRLAEHINRRMPPHARPNFIRVCERTLADLELQEKKTIFQLQEYNPFLIDDPLYYYDEQQETYLPLTREIYQAIIESKIEF